MPDIDLRVKCYSAKVVHSPGPVEQVAVILEGVDLIDLLAAIARSDVAEERLSAAVEAATGWKIEEQRGT